MVRAAESRGGFWFPVLQSGLEYVHDRWSTYAFANRRFSRLDRKRDPAVSEKLLLAWLIIGVVWLSVVRTRPVFWWLASWPLQTFGLFVALYHIVIDIFVFALHWTFVAERPIESYRRSLAAFLVNIAELAVFSAIVLLLSGCKTPSVELLRMQFGDVFGLAVTSCDSSWLLGFPTLKTVVGGFLVLVVLGATINGLGRRQYDTKR